jgi:hypothetical protein
MKRQRIPFGIGPHEVVRSLQAIQDDSPIKFTKTNYRSGAKRKTTFFRFLGIVTLIGNLTRKLLLFPSYPTPAADLSVSKPINVGE